MKKLQLKRRKKTPEVPSRITNETVAEHRERILAGGRRFKYPIQYARHRLVINTIIISFVALLLLVGIGWQQLYLAQNTGTFFYRVTRVLPLPVANIDGQGVLYRDYLMMYRSSVHYLQQKERVDLSSSDGKRQTDYYKSQSMQRAVADAFAVKLAQQEGIVITNKQVDDFIEKERTSREVSFSKETQNAILEDYYGWTAEEYKDVTKNKLLRQEVAYAIDDQARRLRDEVQKLIAGNTNLVEVANAAGGNDAGITVERSGFVPKTNLDGGRSAVASKLKNGQISDVVKSTSGDGYYFVKLIESNETQVNYEYIRIPLTEFNDRLKVAYDQNKVNEYIAVPEVTGPTQG